MRADTCRFGGGDFMVGRDPAVNDRHRQQQRRRNREGQQAGDEKGKNLQDFFRSQPPLGHLPEGPHKNEEDRQGCHHDDENSQQLCQNVSLKQSHSIVPARCNHSELQEMRRRFAASYKSKWRDRSMAITVGRFRHSFATRLPLSPTVTVGRNFHHRFVNPFHRSLGRNAPERAFDRAGEVDWTAMPFAREVFDERYPNKTQANSLPPNCLVAEPVHASGKTMEILKNLTDDQFALLCCAAALVTTGTLMSLSYFLGPYRVAAHLNNSATSTAAPRGAEAVAHEEIGRRARGRNAA